MGDKKNEREGVCEFFDEVDCGNISCDGQSCPLDESISVNAQAIMKIVEGDFSDVIADYFRSPNSFNSDRVERVLTMISEKSSSEIHNIFVKIRLDLFLGRGCEFSLREFSGLFYSLAVKCDDLKVIRGILFFVESVGFFDRVIESGAEDFEKLDEEKRRVVVSFAEEYKGFIEGFGI